MGSDVDAYIIDIRVWFYKIANQMRWYNKIMATRSRGVVFSLCQALGEAVLCSVLCSPVQEVDKLEIVQRRLLACSQSNWHSPRRGGQERWAYLA